MTHFYRRCAGAQNGEPPPLSPPQRRGTRGWGNKYFKVGGLRFLQALTPRALNCRPALARPSHPLSRHRERGWGERADTPVATLGAILCAVRIDFRLPPQINPYPAQPATGVLGQRPKRVLLTFAQTKVSPRRVGVLTKPFIRLTPPEVITNFFTNAPPAGVQIMITKRLAPPQARRNYDIVPLRGGWGAGLIFAEECPAAGRRRCVNRQCRRRPFYGTAAVG